VSIPILLLCVFEARSEQARNVQAYDVVHKLASKVRSFKEEEGRYPKSLKELQSANYLTEQEKRTTQELIKITQQNNWNDLYNYELLTNGFSIVVHGTESEKTSWFGKPQKALRYSETEGKTVDFDSP
jgi:hypothetical protein